MLIYKPLQRILKSVFKKEMTNSEQAQNEPVIGKST